MSGCDGAEFLTTAHTLLFLFLLLFYFLGFCAQDFNGGISGFTCQAGSSAELQLTSMNQQQGRTWAILYVCTMWPNANSLLCVRLCAEVFDFIKQTHDRRRFISVQKQIWCPDTEMKIQLTIILYYEV